MRSREMQIRAGLQEMMCSFAYAGLRDQWSIHKQMSCKELEMWLWIPAKRQVAETWESAYRSFGQSASTVAHSPGCWQEGPDPPDVGLAVGCLNILRTWQLALLE